ncbi:hypothetical protein HZA38_04885 [Candidatus Peregrinibacteria bacterium]|nr:hypothetical protein [Candidatus Peregrinibacteria bacterium]
MKYPQETSISKILSLSCFSLAAGFLIVFFLYFQKEGDPFFANIAPKIQENEEKVEASIPLVNFSDLILTRDVDALHGELYGIPGNEELLKDLRKCTFFEDVDQQNFSSGFWLSFNCAENDNVLHPYFGFFALRENKIQRVFWGQAPKGKIISETIEGKKKILEIQNDSYVPWSRADTWVNFAGKNIQVESENAEIETGKIVKFITDAEDDVLFFQNLDGKYFLDLAS